MLLNKKRETQQMALIVDRKRSYGPDREYYVLISYLKQKILMQKQHKAKISSKNNKQLQTVMKV